MNRLVGAVAVTALLLFSSCMEDQFTSIANKSNSENLDSLLISSDFHWTTSKNVSVKVLGLPTGQTINSTLKISAGNDIYYTGLHAIGDTLTLSIDVPATVQELTLTMGSIKRTSPVIGSNAEFSYLTPSVNL